MSKIGVFLADGCEEVEALTVVDIARRAGIEVITVSVTGKREITSSHKVTFLADALKDEVDYTGLDGIVLPGGMPGTLNLGADQTVTKVAGAFSIAGKLVAAICAAPSVLGQEGILKGKKATCHPGFEEKLTGAEFVEQPVVVCGNVITSRGMGTAIDFGLAIVEYFADKAAADKIAAALVYQR